MVSFFIALIIPVFNYIKYYNFKKAIRKSSVVKIGEHGAEILKNLKEATDTRLAFGKDPSFDQWEAGPDKEQHKIDEKAKKALTKKIAAMGSVKHVWEVLDGNASPNDDYEVKPCDKKGTPWSVWKGDKAEKWFETKVQAKAFKADADADAAAYKSLFPFRSPMWRHAKDEKGEPKQFHLVCGPTHESM